MPSIRSAAELKALTTALEAALARSAATIRASCSALPSSSRRRILRVASANSSATISAAITVSLVSPISPNFLRSSSIRPSRSLASASRCSSCPSSQARRYWRPAIVAFTCAISFFLAHDLVRKPVPTFRDHALLVSVQHRLDAGDGRVQPLRDLAVAGLQPALDRGIKRIQRQRQTLHRAIDRALVGHRHHPRSKTLAGAKI